MEKSRFSCPAEESKRLEGEGEKRGNHRERNREVRREKRRERNTGKGKER